MQAAIAGRQTLSLWPLPPGRTQATVPVLPLVQPQGAGQAEPQLWSEPQTYRSAVTTMTTSPFHKRTLCGNVVGSIAFSDHKCNDQCSFRDTAKPVFYTRGLFQTAHWDGRVQDGQGGGLTQQQAEEGDPGEGAWQKAYTKTVIGKSLYKD